MVDSVCVLSIWASSGVIIILLKGYESFGDRTKAHTTIQHRQNHTVINAHKTKVHTDNSTHEFKHAVFYTALYLTRWYRLPVFAALTSSTPKMEAICFSETVETQRTTQCHIPQDDTTCRFLLNLFLPPWRWRRYFPPKRRLKLNGLHGVIFQM
jgi:hypothetical protein